MKTAWLVSLCLLCMATGLANTNAPVEVKCPAAYNQLGQFTRQAAEVLINEITDKLALDAAPVKIVLTAQENDFEKYTQTALPEWASAVTIFPPGVIVIKTPDLTRSTLRAYRTALRHELVHLLQGKQVPLNLTPTWFNEGLATYLTGEFDIDQRVTLSRALWSKRLIPLEQLDELLHFPSAQAELAYAECAGAVEFLISIYGSSTVSTILQRMQQGTNFDAVLSEIIATDETFSDLYQQYLTKHFTWIFLLDIQNFLWLIIPGLVFLAYLSIRHRNKSILQKWNAEEITQENAEQI